MDENSLEQAIDVLLRLSESNRLVGIISHVGELKERIGRQIVVTKTPDGGSMQDCCGQLRTAVLFTVSYKP